MRTTNLFKLLILVSIFTFSGAYICLKYPICSCSKRTITKVTCSGVRKASLVLPALDKYDHIDKFQMSGSLTNLTSGVFNGRSIASLVIYGPLQTVAEDALMDIKGLEVVRLTFTGLVSIPQAVTLESLKNLSISHGNITEIGTELQGMSAVMNLVLDFNKISRISTAAFNGLQYLEILNLSFNDLSHLGPELFTPLKNLRIIDLSNNQLVSISGCLKSVSPQVINLYNNSLTNIDNVFHSGMWSVRELNLGANPSLNLTGALFKGLMKSLSILTLQDNHFQSVDPQLLKYFPQLLELRFSGNDLDHIPGEFFSYTSNLNTVELSDNSLTSTDELFVLNRMRLRRIKLDGNRLSSIKGGISSETIIRLDMSRNAISELRSGDLKHLSFLTEINLSSNPIEVIDSDVLKLNHKLNIVDLSNTRLKELNRSLLHITSLSQLRVQSSELQRIDEEELAGLRFLKSVHLSNNSLSTIYGAFRFVPAIVFLDVSSNNLTTLTADSFPVYRGATVHLRNLQMAGNPWICDCRLSWIPYWLEKRGELLDEPVCESPAHLNGRNISSLNQTELDLWLDDCPENCDCLCSPIGEDVSIAVNCSNRNVVQFPSRFPAKVKEMDFSNNKIEQIDGLGSYYKELRKLNLEDNKLFKLSSNLPSLVEELLLARNSLRLFPYAYWEENSINVTTLSGNPWICDCNHGWKFREWLIAHNDSVLDLQNIRCGSQEGFFIRNQVIIYLERKDFCSPLTPLHIAVITVFCVITLTLLLLCVCLRKGIAALFYSCGCTFLKNQNKFQDPYDVFLLYADEDEEIALSELAEGLESGNDKFNVCIPCRNIPEPRTIERISAFTAQSSKIIVLLTRSFLADGTSLRLLRSAMSFSLEDTSRQVIFVTHGKLPSFSSLDPSLLKILKTSDRLRWGSFLFWPRLVYRLPRKYTPPDEADPSTVRLLDDLN
ncbi:slit homolog 1 protein-like [Uloborus diversus]|uniref:slit homolog 1 protein-like n=1 Tax=Uloborus diversus TaxID=327109 RepID=UPI00240A7E78|nr:slit homolog 1 protein-like [Uloborus diversus]